MKMLGHVSVEVKDLTKSRRLYDAAFGPLGYKCTVFIAAGLFCAIHPHGSAGRECSTRRCPRLRHV